MLTTEPARFVPLRPDAIDRMDRATFRAWCATLPPARVQRWSEIADRHTAAAAANDAACRAVDALSGDPPNVIGAVFEAARVASERLASVEAELAAERAALSPDAAAFLRALPQPAN